MRWAIVFLAVDLAALLVFAACSESTPAPLGPDRPATQAASATHGVALEAVLGTGGGIVNVTPTAEDQGTFHVQATVNVHGAPPNTTYLVQRAPDLVLDGECTGPWITFPIPNPGPLATLTTSPGGSGAAHTELGVAGPFVSGVQFNVRFRLIDDVAAPSALLQTECFTVTVK